MDAISGARVRHFFGGIADLVFPPRCFLCGVVSELAWPLAPFCRSCLRGLRPKGGRKCARCGAQCRSQGRSQGRTEFTSDGGCGRCHGLKYQFESAWALGDYQGEIRRAVLQMKLKHQESLTRSIGKLLGQEAQEAGLLENIDFITEVPIQLSRHFSRGYNVAELLIEAFHRQAGLVWRKNTLKYLRRTRKQGTLTTQQRFRNVHRSMAVSAGYDLTHSRVLLVDDVMTTGATVNEASRAFLAAGAASVRILVVARGGGTQRRLVANSRNSAKITAGRERMETDKRYLEE